MRLVSDRDRDCESDCYRYGYCYSYRFRTFCVDVVASVDAGEEEGRGRLIMMIWGWRSACNVGARCAREASVMGESATHTDAAVSRG